MPPLSFRLALLLRACWSTSPCWLLGCARLVAVKSTDYQVRGEEGEGRGRGAQGCMVLGGGPPVLLTVNVMLASEQHCMTNMQFEFTLASLLAIIHAGTFTDGVACVCVW